MILYSSTYGGDNRDGVEEGPGKSPVHLALIFTSIPPSLLQSDDEVLFKSSQLVGDFLGPIILTENFHLSEIRRYKRVGTQEDLQLLFLQYITSN